jgi:biofilm protein TabA
LSQRYYICTKIQSMIIDSLQGFERYLSMHPAFPAAFRFMTETNLTELACGRHEIDGNKLYCTIWEGEGKGLEIPPLEVHDSYIDIHILLEGNESIGFKNRAQCFSENTPYDESRDIAFYDEAPHNFINISPGNIALFFPHDAHAPLIGEGHIKKAVIKVSI